MNMNNIIKMLMVDEGLRLSPYPDSEGNITIGIGNNLTEKGITTAEQAHEKYPNGITREQAIKDAENYVNEIVERFKKIFPLFFTLSDVRQAVIINMTYNLGVKGLFQFIRMLNYLKDKKYNFAAIDITKSLAAKQLPERYGRLAYMMNSDKWSPVYGIS